VVNIEGLVRHMTPATLHGYNRFCPDASEGLSSIPTVKATGSTADEVHGMLIFGWHDSHSQGSRKYESKHEHNVEESVVLELQDGNTMEVEATVRVWNEEVAETLTPYARTWEPHDMLRGEWYGLMPWSVRAEDDKMRAASLLGAIANRHTLLDTSGRTLRKGAIDSLSLIRKHSLQEKPNVQEELMTGMFQNSNEDFGLTENVIGDLFYSGVCDFACLVLVCCKPTEL
jgi:hypothetical protein